MFASALWTSQPSFPPSRYELRTLNLKKSRGESRPPPSSIPFLGVECLKSDRFPFVTEANMLYFDSEGWRGRQART
jgi:hypothetical protein